MAPPLKSRTPKESPVVNKTAQRFFETIPSVLVRFSLLKYLNYRELAHVEAVSVYFKQQVALSEPKLALIKAGYRQLYLAMTNASSTLTPEAVRLIRQPHVLLALGEGLLSTQDFIAIELNKLALLLTKTAVKAFYAYDFTFLAASQFDEILLTLLFGTRSAFQQIIRVNADLKQYAIKYPQVEPAFFKRLFTDSVEFQRLVVQVYHLIDLAELFPDYAPRLLSQVLDNDREFQRIFSTMFMVNEAADELPELAENIINHILSHPAEFTRLITQCDDFIHLAEAFPASRATLVDWLLAHSEQQQRLLTNHYEFIRVIRFFDQQASTLVDYILAHEEASLFLANNDDFINAMQQIPTQAEKFMHYLLYQPGVFQRIIVTYVDLINAASECPSYATRLLANVFDNEEEWDRLITDREDEQHLVSALPEHQQQILKQWQRRQPAEPRLSC